MDASIVVTTWVLATDRRAAVSRPYLSLACQCDDPSGADETPTIPISLDTSGGGTTGMLRGPHNGRQFICLAERSQYWEDVNCAPVQDEGRVTIDGEQYDFGYFSTNLLHKDGGELREILSDLGVHISYTKIDGRDDFIMKHKGFKLWADEILLRLTAKTDGEPTKALSAELIRGKLRTRRDVLDGIRSLAHAP